MAAITSRLQCVKIAASGLAFPEMDFKWLWVIFAASQRTEIRASKSHPRVDSNRMSNPVYIFIISQLDIMQPEFNA